MSITLNFPAKYASLSVGDTEYHPDADGHVFVENPDHVDDLMRFGATNLSAVIQFAEPTPEEAPTEAVEAPEATEVAPEAEEAPEAPTEATEEATADFPSDDATKIDLVEWLVKRGVDVPSQLTKAEAWEMIEKIKAESN